jgi:hypothetical protein
MASAPGNGAATPLREQESRQLPQDPQRRKVAMSLPADPSPRPGDGRWETIRYALGSNACTFRLCAILLAAAVASAGTGLSITELLRHML